MSPSSRPIRIGTRGSMLARTQTDWVASALGRLGHATEISVITTRGDVPAADGGSDRPAVPVPQLGGDGVFVRELQRALLEDRIDLAVHSLKDLPTAPVEGLRLACVPVREQPFDVLVGRTAATVDSLPRAAVVGTSSVRRVVQMRRLRPDLTIREIRGNVDTRLRRLDAGEYDAIVLAAAGLSRLGLEGRITEVLRPDRFWPAVGQGALGLETRDSDAATIGRIAGLSDPASQVAVVAERACLAGLAGGCLAPVAAFGRIESGKLLLGGCVLGETDRGIDRLLEAGSIDLPGAVPLHGEPSAEALSAAASLGRDIAVRLETAGADKLLAAFRSSNRPTVGR